MNADWAPGGRQPSDQVKRLRLWVHWNKGSYHPLLPSPFVIITQPVSWCSFYRPAKGGRLSRSWHCSEGAQPVPKAVYRSGRRNKKLSPRASRRALPRTSVGRCGRYMSSSSISSASPSATSSSPCLITAVASRAARTPGTPRIPRPAPRHSNGWRCAGCTGGSPRGPGAPPPLRCSPSPANDCPAPAAITQALHPLRSLVTSVLGHFGPFFEDRSDQGPKWMYPSHSLRVSTNVRHRHCLLKKNSSDDAVAS